MLAEAQALLGDDAELHLAPAEQLPFADGAVVRAVMNMVAHLIDRPRAFGELRRVLSQNGVFVLSTADPDGMDGFWLVPYFPRFLELDRERFPSADALETELRGAGFGAVHVQRSARQRSFDRATALARLEGRAFSTFALMSDDEYEAGLARARASLPSEVRYTLRRLVVTARARPA
jgi:SAM-dependent methyltransferase